MSRPTKLNAETQRLIIDALAKGATRKDASESAGVSYASFIGWMHEGEEAKGGTLFKFFKAVTKAEADLRAKLAGMIVYAAAQGDWKAAEAYLKRRDNANWGDKQAVEHSGAVRLIEVDIVDDGQDED